MCQGDSGKHRGSTEPAPSRHGAGTGEGFCRHRAGTEPAPSRHRAATGEATGEPAPDPPVDISIGLL